MSTTPKHATRSKTMLVNGAVAVVAILSLLQEHGTALHIPQDWMARIAFAGAVATMLLRRYTWSRPVRFRRRKPRHESWEESSGEQAPKAVDEPPAFV